MKRLIQVLQQSGLSIANTYTNSDSLTIHVNHVKEWSEQQKAATIDAVKVFDNNLTCKLWTNANKPYHLACFVIAKAL